MTMLKKGGLMSISASIVDSMSNYVVMKNTFQGIIFNVSENSNCFHLIASYVNKKLYYIGDK